jgi:hypothetical protein
VHSVRANDKHARGPSHAWLAALLGGLLGLCLVKFGNPVILDRLVARPETMLELLFNAWPLSWGLVLAAIVVGISPLVLITARRQISQTQSSHRLPPVICFLPLAWYAWQWIATIGTVDPTLTRVTMAHFTVCIALFYVGLFCLAEIRILTPLFLGLLAGFILVLWSGFDQRFGGLEATRQMLYETAELDLYPPEFLRRIASDRIFGTLFYPNTLAGVILLVAPFLTWFVHQITVNRSNIVRGTSLGLLAYASVACLFWSQSKAGWLVAAAMVFITLLQVPTSPRVRWSCAAAIALLALLVFAVRFSDYFARGAASASARIDYWEAAWTTARLNPMTGTGPGTFQIPYATLKRPESEMARLTHNDYLQQASDGGWPSMVLYTCFLFGSVGLLYRKARLQPLRFSIWLGLTGWVMHSLVEFGLYIPAIAWPAFTLLGWLWAVSMSGRSPPDPDIAQRGGAAAEPEIGISKSA